MITKFLLIAAICTLIIESGFFDEMEKNVSHMLYKDKFKVDFGKWFHCELCASVWANLFLMLVTQTFSLYNFCIVLLIGYSTNMMADLLHIVLDGWALIKSKIYDKWIMR